MSDAFDLRGGPAFPISISGVGDNVCPGMSLRDWFAGQALAGMCASYSVCKVDLHQMLTQNAYALADQMLAERDRK